MSDKERLDLARRVQEALNLSTLNMLIRKKKLGERVVTADAGGRPEIITPDEALLRFGTGCHPEQLLLG